MCPARQTSAATWLLTAYQSRCLLPCCALRCSGAHAGRWNAFWNLRASQPPPPPPPDAAAAGGSSGTPSRRLRAGDDGGSDSSGSDGSGSGGSGSDGSGGGDDGGSGKPKPKPLRLPKCDFGALLTFVGKYRARDGDVCASAGWLVEELEEGAPADLHAAQVAERAAQAAPQAPQ